MRLRESLLLILALSVLLGPSCRAQATAGARALQLFNQGRFAQAQPLFEKLVQDEPTNYRAVYYLALTYLKIGQTDKAKTSFETVLKYSPASPEARYSSTELGLMAAARAAAARPAAAAQAPKPATVATQASLDKDSEDALESAAALKAKGEREAQAYEAKARETEAQMLAVPAGGRGATGCAYNQADIDAATADFHRLARQARQSADRAAADILNRAMERRGAQERATSNASSRPGFAALPPAVTTARGETSGSPAATQASSMGVPYIDEIAYWQKVKTVLPQNNWTQALMIKPKYRSQILAGTTTVDLITFTNYDYSDKEMDLRWIAAQQSAEHSFSVQTSPAIKVAGYDINQFVGYQNGQRPGYDGDGICYKVFFEFKDATRDLTPSLYLAFVRKLGEAGFVGDSKVCVQPGYVRFFYNNIIVHAGSIEQAKLAERVGLELCAPLLEHFGRGVDVMQSQVGGRWTEPVDWHHFLGKTRELDRLPQKAQNYVQFIN